MLTSRLVVGSFLTAYKKKLICYGNRLFALHTNHICLSIYTEDGNWCQNGSVGCCLIWSAGAEVPVSAELNLSKSWGDAFRVFLSPRNWQIFLVLQVRDPSLISNGEW